MEPSEKGISVSRQCEILGVPRSSHYEGACKIEAKEETALNQSLLGEIDRIYTEWPFYGSRRIAKELCRRGYEVNRKRIQRLMRVMGIMGVAPGPMTSKPHPEAKRWPYLLTGVKVERPNQVWSSDITYIPMGHGFMYLVAVVDWHSRKILSWELSNSMDGSFCVKALSKALYAYGKPEIFNTDQGSQFTSSAFTGVLERAGARISMDGRGRAMDNIFIERFWRNVKYEDIYLHGYATPTELREGLNAYFDFYNNRRLHQSLDYMTPSEVHAMSAMTTGGAPGGLLRRYNPPVAKSSARVQHLILSESCP
jgi:putative transposase